MNRLLIVWILAVLTTLAVAIYQRTSGPTYPLKLKVDDISIKLPRSSSQNVACTISVPGSPNFNNARIIWRYFPGEYSYDTIPMQFQNNYWIGELPTQPPAGKLQYFIELYQDETPYFSSVDRQAIIRYKGEVPTGALVPHIIFMFLASLFSFVALYMIIFKSGNFNRIHQFTVVSLFLGGLVFGPIVQKFAFGAYWTGFPVGMDLTDNKTLIVFLIWLIPFMIKKMEIRRKWIIIAAICMLIINSIPHSTLGSELNRKTNTIETGK